MIPALVAVLLADLTSPPTAPPDVPPLRSIVTPDMVLARYAAALAALPVPPVVSFEYELEQTGARDLLQTVRVFRSGVNQRDEVLAVDGRALDAPAIRITHGRRDRYAVGALAPKADDYVFHFVGTVRDGHHVNYVFQTAAREPAAFRITAVTIDGVTYLPKAISFETDAHAGSGTITFVRAGAYWVPDVATAHATYAKLSASEHITFSDYRFPASLPPGTFAQAHPRPTPKPD